MCAPTTPRSARGCRGTSRNPAGDNALVHAGDVIFRIDDGDYASRWMPRAPKSRPSRPPSIASAVRSPHWKSAVGQANAQLASADAALKRAGLDSTVSGAQHQGICLARDLRGVGSRPRSGRGGGKAAQAAYDAARDMSRSPGRSRPRPRAQLANCKPPLAKASATSTHIGAPPIRWHVFQPSGLHRRLHRGRGNGSAM